MISSPCRRHRRIKRTTGPSQGILKTKKTTTRAIITCITMITNWGTKLYYTIIGENHEILKPRVLKGYDTKISKMKIRQPIDWNLGQNIGDNNLKRKNANQPGSLQQTLENTSCWKNEQFLKIWTFTFIIPVDNKGTRLRFIWTAGATKNKNLSFILKSPVWFPKWLESHYVTT